VMPTAWAAVAGATVAAALGYLFGRVLPDSGVAASAVFTGVVAAVALTIFLGVVAVLDRSTLTLLLRRRRADA
jgi:high-affinity Fe2+/Pb2+ permease